MESEKHNHGSGDITTSAGRKRALKFVFIMGLVSLFADMTYEGARSITGPFMLDLGASAAVVGVIAGLGELFGYSLRLFSGYVADRTRNYWGIAVVGYLINLLAVPLLALAGRWEIAAVLMLSERFGKAVRTPSRDAMLSHAAVAAGHGWTFGVHEALDQIGAVLGPMIIVAVIFYKGTFAAGFAFLLAPAMIAICVLLYARATYPNPRDFESPKVGDGARKLPKKFWIYMAAVSLVAAGYADFPLIAFHIGKSASIRGEWIPAFYAIAMGADAVSALALGRLYDRKGVSVLMAAVFVSAFFAPLVFLGGPVSILAGALLWGIGMGAQESIMRAEISKMAGAARRGTVYGIFNTGYGISWAAGSAAMGLLYDHSLPALIEFSVAVQILSIPVFMAVGHRK